MSTTPNSNCGRIHSTAFCLVMACLVCGCNEPLSPPPAQILGGWVTDAPRHRDRTFEIRDGAVVFGTGKYSGSRLYILIGVEERPDLLGWKAYALHYREYDGSIGTLEIHHRSGPKAELRFAHRSETWTRWDTGRPDDA